ncbi:hypothetical protein ES705_29570 [subsurface metagenome]
MGSTGLSISFSSIKSQILPPYLASTAIALAESKALPPPKPITMSTLALRARAPPSLTAFIVGFDCTSSKSSTSIPTDDNFFIALSVNPDSFMLLFPVTRRALFPKLFTTCGN